MAEFLSEQHQQCLAAFHNLWEVAENQTSLDPEGITVQRLQELNDRYTVWAANLGVGHSGVDYKKSLDHRLRDAAIYKQVISKALSRLVSLINQVSREVRSDPIDVTAGGEDSILPETNIDQNDEESDSSAWSLSSSGDNDQLIDASKMTAQQIDDRRTHVPLEPRLFARYKDELELDDVLDSIEFTISALYKIPIRKVNRMGHSEKTENDLWPESVAYEYFDIQFVVDLYRLADANLQKRLGKLITLRRRILRFRRQRNEALQRATVDSGVKSVTTTTRSEYASDVKQLIAADTPMQLSKAMSEVPTTVKATTFRPANEIAQHLEVFFDAGISEATSETSMATTQAAKDALSFPSRPKRSDGSEKDMFECPYCQLLVHIKSQRQWEKHVLDDMEPYVCVRINCGDADHLYADRGEWFQHFLQHELRYQCMSDGHPDYQDFDLFEQHMRDSHTDDIHALSALALSRVYQKFIDPAKILCPLCKKTSKNLSKHLGRHLERIALFALPRNTELDDPGLAGEDSIAAVHSDPATSQNTDDEGQGSDLDSVVDGGSPGDVGDREPRNSSSFDVTRGFLQMSSEDNLLNFTVPDSAEISWTFVKPELDATATVTTDNGLRDHASEARHDSQLSFWAIAQILVCMVRSQRRVRLDRFAQTDWMTFFRLDGVSMRTIGSDQQIAHQRLLHQIISGHVNYTVDMEAMLARYSSDTNFTRGYRDVDFRFLGLLKTTLESISDLVRWDRRYFFPRLMARITDQGPLLRDVGVAYWEWFTQVQSSYDRCQNAISKIEKFCMYRNASIEIQYVAQVQIAPLRSSLPEPSDWLARLRLPLRHLERISELFTTISTSNERFDYLDLQDSHAISRLVKAIGPGLRNLDLLFLMSKIQCTPLEWTRLDLGSGSRRLVHQSPVTRKRTRSSRTEETMHLTLLDNYLVLFREPSGSAHYKIIEMIPVMFLRYSPPDQLSTVDREFEVGHTGWSRVHVLTAPSMAVKTIWHARMEEAKTSSYAAFNSQPYNFKVLASLGGGNRAMEHTVPYPLVSRSALHDAIENAAAAWFHYPHNQGSIEITCAARTRLRDDTLCNMTIVSTRYVTLVLRSSDVEEIANAAIKQISLRSSTFGIDAMYLADTTLWRLWIPRGGARVDSISTSIRTTRFIVVEDSHVLVVQRGRSRLGRSREYLVKHDKSNLVADKYEVYWGPADTNISIVDFVGGSKHIQLTTTRGFYSIDDETISKMISETWLGNHHSLEGEIEGLRAVGAEGNSYPVFYQHKGSVQIRVLNCGLTIYNPERNEHYSRHLFSSPCLKAFMHGWHLIAVCCHVVEIRDVQNGGKLVQIIEGENIDAWPSYGSAAPQFMQDKDSGFVFALRNPKDRTRTLVLDASLKLESSS